MPQGKAVPIALPLTSAPGQHGQESAGRLVNCYAVPLQKGARNEASRRRVPGLTSWGTSGGTNFRGMLLVSSTLYAVWNSRVEKFTSAAGAGTLVSTTGTGTDDVFMARNNNATPQIVMVSPANGAFSITSTTVTSFADSDLPAPNSVCFVGGYFFFTIGDGRCFATDLNAITVNPLNFATAESKPDTLYRAIPLGGQLLLCGSNSMEVWGPPINATAFPFSYVHTISKGLAGRYAIAGFEDGFGQGLIFVGDDNAVHMLSGYQPNKISPPDLDRLIEAVSDKDTLKASVHVSAGRAVFVLSCADWTWEFSLNSLKWNERESYGLARWRGKGSQYAFGKWLCGDTESGNILEISASTPTEVDDPLRMRIESGPASSFPYRTRIDRIDVDVTAGVGDATGTDPIATDPAVQISVAPDGVTFGPPRLAKIGRQEITDQRVFATRFGLSGAPGMRVRLDISDPVDVGVMGLSVTPRAA